MHQYVNFFSSNPDKCKSEVLDFQALLFLTPDLHNICTTEGFLAL